MHGDRVSGEVDPAHPDERHLVHPGRHHDQHGRAGEPHDAGLREQRADGDIDRQAE
jgi:hypothetical protein